MVVFCEAEGGYDDVGDLVGFVQDLDCGGERVEVCDCGVGEESGT